MEKQLSEVISYLRGGDVAARGQAATILAGFFEEHQAILVKLNLIPVLLQSLNDVPQVSASVVAMLVNLSAQEKTRALILAEEMTMPLIIRFVESKRTLEEKDHALKLLSNLTVDEKGQRALMQEGTKIEGLYVFKLLMLFRLPIPAGVQDPYEFIAKVLCNVSCLAAGRKLLVDEKRQLIAFLLPSLQSPNLTRRRAVIETVRNCCFESEIDSSLKFFLSKDLGLVDAVLISLTGHTYEIDDEDRQSLSPAVLKALNSKDKVPEQDEGCRRLLLEIVRMFLWTRESADQVKTMGAYFVVRELHKWEQSEALLVYIEDELVSKFFHEDTADLPPVNPADFPEHADRLKSALEPTADSSSKANIEVVEDEEEAKEKHDGEEEEDEEDEDTDAELERELAEYDALMAKKATEEQRAAELKKLHGDDSDSD